jgi:integrase
VPDLTVVGPAPESVVERLVDDYLIDCQARGLARSTLLNSYGYPLRNLLVPWCAERGITEIGTLDKRAINDFSIYIQEAGGRRGPLSKHSVHAYIRAIRGFLNWCEREGEKVAAKPALPRLPRVLVDTLDHEELDRLEGAAQTERDKVIIRVLAETGLRADELCTLRIADIRRHDQRAELHVAGKRYEERLVPISPTLLRRIDRYVRSGRPSAASERIFVSLRTGRSGEYEPLTPSGVLSLIKSAADRAAIPKRVYTHLLRHSFITNALRAGMPPLLVRKVVGHSSMKMIEQVYEHLNQDDAYTAMMTYLRHD